MHSTARGAGPRRDAGGTGRPPRATLPAPPRGLGAARAPRAAPQLPAALTAPRGLAARGMERGRYLLNGSPQPAPRPHGCAGAAPSTAGAAGSGHVQGGRLAAAAHAPRSVSN